MATTDQLLAEITSLTKQKTAIENQLQTYKSEFSNYVKNRSISIFERWHAFAAAPKEVKNNLSHLPYPRGPQLKKQIEHMTHMPECYGRGKQIDTLDLFWDAYSVEEKKFYPGGFDYKCKLEPAQEYSLEQIQGVEMFELMEELLQANLGSFCFDW